MADSHLARGSSEWRVPDVSITRRAGLVYGRPATSETWGTPRIRRGPARCGHGLSSGKAAVQHSSCLEYPFHAAPGFFQPATFSLPMTSPVYQPKIHKYGGSILEWISRTGRSQFLKVSTFFGQVLPEPRLNIGTKKKLGSLPDLRTTLSDGD